MLLQIFAAWPLPAGPAWTIVRPIAARIGWPRANDAGLAPDHERQTRGRGAGDAARYRRVEHVEAGGRGRGGDRPGGLDIDRRAVDQQRSVAGMGEHAVRAEIDRAHLRPRRQHRDHDLAGGSRLCGARRRRARPAPPRRRPASGTRSKPVTRCPALTRFAAIGAPILPSPIKPIVAIAACSPCRSRLVEEQFAIPDRREIGLDHLVAEIGEPRRLPAWLLILVDQHRPHPS